LLGPFFEVPGFARLPKPLTPIFIAFTSDLILGHQAYNFAHSDSMKVNRNGSEEQRCAYVVMYNHVIILSRQREDILSD
jgi:hypothetical protein